MVMAQQGLLLAVLVAGSPPPLANTCLSKQGLPWAGVGTLFCCGGNATHPATRPCSKQNQQCCATGTHSSNGGAGTSPCVPERTPQYHVRDASCALNDPNAPFFDPVHKIHHVFYQAHLAQVDPVHRPGAGPAVGPVYGHAVSHDLVTWARLPVALWNDEFYDSKALYTGSATMVPGRGPVIIYPGISDPPTGGTINLAEPANRSDPLLARWTKSRHNPLMTGTSDDPSTAWQTASGEYRFVGQTVATAHGGGMPLYSAGSSFENVSLIGVFKHEQGGDCMSIFPLPPAAVAPASADRPDMASVRRPGADDHHAAQGRSRHHARSQRPRPTHVMMQSAQTKLGVLTDAPPGEMSTWRNSAAVPSRSDPTCGCSSPGCTANFQCGFRRLELGARCGDRCALSGGHFD